MQKKTCVLWFSLVYLRYWQEKLVYYVFVAFLCRPNIKFDFENQPADRKKFDFWLLAHKIIFLLKIWILLDYSSSEARILRNFCEINTSSKAQGISVSLSPLAKREAQRILINLRTLAKREAQGIFVNLSPQAKRET